MKCHLLAVLLILASVTSACGRSTMPAATAEPAFPSLAATAVNTLPAGRDPFAPPAASEEGLSRVDEQGAVIVEVTPLNLDPAAGELRFEVAMNTHSVDLSMDLASLSTLSTDTGLQLQASRWDAPTGGHHVSGTLVFPAQADAAALFAEASALTLTMRDVDAPVRVFEWSLP